MACGMCGSKIGRKTYEWTSKDGKITLSFASEMEARAKVARVGGTYRVI